MKTLEREKKVGRKTYLAESRLGAVVATSRGFQPDTVVVSRSTRLTQAPETLR